MKDKKLFRFALVPCIFLLLIVSFFYPVFTKGYVPFPGDLLLAQYQPWRSSSFGGFTPGSIPHKAQYFDTLRQLYPWKTFGIKTLATNTLPLWNPHNFSGSPLFANFQSAFLFPLNILYLFLPQVTAWSILVILQPTLCLVIVFFLARKYGLSKLAAVFSASSYAFCLYMTTFLEYNIMGHFMYLVPLGMLSIEWIVERKKWSPLLLTSVVAISVFAGHAQLFGGTVFFLLLYSLMRTLQVRKGFSSRLFLLLFLVFFIVTGIGVGAIQLLPGFELISESARSPHPPEYFYNNLLIHPWQLVLYFIPDLFGNPATRNYLVPFSYPSKAIYIGLVAFFLAGLSFFSKNKNEYWKTIVIVTLVMISLVFLNPLSYILYQLRLPFLSTSSPSNFVFLVSLGLCLLSGFGMDYIRTSLSKKTYILLGFFWFIFIGIFLVTNVLKFQIIRNNLIYSSIILFVLTSVIVLSRFIKKKEIFIGYLLVLISCLDLFYFFHKFNPFVPASFVYPPTQIGIWLTKNAGIDRVWGYGSAAIEANFSTQIGFLSPDGYDPLYPKRYGELIQSANDGNIPGAFDDRTRSDAVIAGGYGETNMVDNHYRLKILSLLGVSFILDKTENGSTIKTFPSQMFERSESLGDFTILRYKDAAPRFFLTTSFNTFSTKKDFTTKLFNKDFDLTQTILLEEQPGIKASKNLGEKSAKLMRYQPNSINIKTTSTTPALLYLSDTYYPGWNGYIDNIPTKIYRANYAFRAIAVPIGEHEVAFRYEPKSVTRGLFLSVVSIIITLGGWFIYLRRNKKFNKIHGQK